MKYIKYLAFTLTLLITTLTYGKPLEVTAPLRQLKDYKVSELVEHFAKQYSISLPFMDEIIDCESSYNLLAHKYTPTGKHRENSWGPVQINLFAHPEITVEQATDKVFAIEYLAKHLAAKDVNWSCAHGK